MTTKEDPVIQVKHLTKEYRIGVDRTYKTFCETAVDTIKSPLKRLKTFSRQEETFWALKDINLEVNQGEVLGIIGRNGAGKTTLLKVLSRITYPTEGEVILRGRVGSLLEVGTGFHPELTGRENIYFNGTILGMKKKEIDDKFDEIVKFAEVENFLDTPVKRYSSGMHVRLAFAVAAHLEPEILLVDEVLSVGDAQFQKKSMGKMSDVAKEGLTILFVSHNMKAIVNLCSSAILLNEGKIVRRGKAKEVVDFYLQHNLETRSLNGEVVLEDITQKGNNSAKINRIRLLNRGNVKGVFDINEDIVVQIDFTNYKDGNDLCYYLHVYDEYENIVFTSANLPSLTPVIDPWFNTPYPAGKYRTSCFIPGSYLNTGNYKIDVNIQYNITQHAALSGPVLNFEITDELGSIKEIHQIWRGMVRPKLQWETEALSGSKHK